MLLAAATATVALSLTGCASGDESTTSAETTGSSQGSSAPATDKTQQVVEVTVSVRDGKVTPKPHTVDVPIGSEVNLQVTSDVDDEVHVHGFDVEEPLEAGHTTTITLHADEKGVYEVETHETELQLLQLEVS
jgi:heme/copper-type cytochrome/quinol oxidase subunit 2